MENDSLFARFGGTTEMARLLEEPRSNVVDWERNRRVPATKQRKVLARGIELGLGITEADVVFPFPEDRLLELVPASAL